MIITKLQGGLGNQMFQYAIGKMLSVKNNQTLKMDIEYYSFYKDRKYLLKYLNIKENIADQKEIKYFIKFKKCHKRFIGKIYNFLFTDEKKYIKEKQFNFDKNILTTKNSCYLDGYWQSEKYFKNIENILRKELTLKNKPTKKTLEWIKKIKEFDSVSIHIRRGDYVSSKKTNQFHGICDLSYYNKAVKIISKYIKSPIFFIFSDDIEWAKKNLKINYPIFFVSNKNIPDYEEIFIMSECKNNIIANSSFSWWGAWLNNNQNKIVIAPKKWFNTKKMNTIDLLPTPWIKL